MAVCYALKKRKEARARRGLGNAGKKKNAYPSMAEEEAPEVSGRAARMAEDLAERSRQTLERVRREGESMSTDENDEFSPLRI